MDEKEFQTYSRAMAFLYEKTGEHCGESWKATFSLKDADDKGAAGKDGKTA